MSAILTPRVDPGSRLAYKPRPSADPSRLAKAEGLTRDDAHMLATWLRSEGYASIEVVGDGEYMSVLWQK